MTGRRLSVVFTVLAILAACPWVMAQAQPAAAGRAVQKPAAAVEAGGGRLSLADANLVFVGTLVEVIKGPMSKSYPPIYHNKLVFEVIEPLRGDAAKGQSITLNHAARQKQPPVFNVGSEYLVQAQNNSHTGNLALQVSPADKEAIREARLLATLPAGWWLEEGKVMSPWSALEDAWPKDAPKPNDAAVCSKTGRPALLAGKGVVFTVAPIPPVQSIQWTNPDGDGDYKITVTNTTAKPMDVPALISDDTGVRWDRSLLILCQGKGRPIPLAAPLKGAPKATRLDAGQIVSTTINVLRLSDVQWPKGGYRIEFTFCLGELASTQSFYYLSRHHDPIREKLQAESSPPKAPPAGK